ncbi:hypothetical protein PRIPAC_97882 [Pristionchus pacificus]|uniref:Trypsin n=1 Tax=Pristionchus pacificus TaxID=54126 RepID=A0A2A6BDQ6_PRIPA|nr:hypothetical protein PRIPAC_97882 [Pristionchus pacificus]|eukprot:PDM64012.1 Trypsin [Pristionchus pacificus]
MLLHLTLLSLFSFTLAHECGISNPIEEQTMDGIAPLGKWPWQVYVRTPDSMCGGTIIGERWILTAAHCFDDQLNGTKFDRLPLIRAGVVNIEEAAKDDFQYTNVHGVKKILVHSEYNMDSVVNDIAILELERPIKYSNTIAPICLTYEDQDVNIDQEAWIIGFGAYIDHETSNVLRETKIPLSRHKKCKSEWKKDDVEKIICAGTHGIGAGEGDSGGPLMVQVSTVRGFKSESFLTVEMTKRSRAYTSISHYCEWIEKVTEGEAKCAENEVEMKLLPEEDREKTEEDSEHSQDDEGDEEHGEEDEEDNEKEEKEDIEEDDSSEENEPKWSLHDIITNSA